MVNTSAPLGCWKFQAFHYQKNEDCQQLIEKLVELTNISNFHVAHIDVLIEHQQGKMPQSLFYLIKKVTE